MKSLKAAYGISELAELMGSDRQRVLRLVRKHGLVPQNHKHRQKIEVPLSRFRDALPELWDSVLLRLQLEESF